MARMVHIDWQPERKFTREDGISIHISGAINHMKDRPFGIVQVFVDGKLLSPVQCPPNHAAVIAAMDRAEEMARSTRAGKLDGAMSVMRELSR